MKEEAQRIQKKTYKYFQQGFLWMHPKKKVDNPLGVICKTEDQRTLVSEYCGNPLVKDKQEFGQRSLNYRGSIGGQGCTKIRYSLLKHVKVFECTQMWTTMMNFTKLTLWLCI